MHNEIDLKLKEIVKNNEPKKKKGFSKLFYATVIMAAILTALSIYSFKKTEKELGFESGNLNIFQIIKQNIQEFIL